MFHFKTAAGAARARPLALAAALLSWTCPAPATPDGATSATVTETAAATFPGTVTAQANPLTLAGLGDRCPTGKVECDVYTIHLNAGSAWLAAHPGAKARVTVKIEFAGDIYETYLKDAAGNVVGSSTADPVQTFEFAAVNGDYTLDVIPSFSFANSYVATVELVIAESGGEFGGPLAGATPTAPGQPRYQVFEAPVGSQGDQQFQGEFNIGFNPKTGRIMTMAAGPVLRLTTPERLTPALPESCDAQWEDVSTPVTDSSVVPGLDPILWTDQKSGRTFSSNFTGGPNAEYAFTDDDGDTWLPIGLALPDGGQDHQTLGTGPYPASSPLAAAAAATGLNAVYYCSQELVTAFCQRSDDGGLSWGPGVPIYGNSGVKPVDNQVLKQAGMGKCASLHGHVRVAPNGTVYVPTAICTDSQGGGVSYDAGNTWREFYVPGTQDTGGTSSDPSVAIDAANNAYFCTVDADGHPKVAVSKDDGRTWGAPVDLGASLGITQAAFPEAIAGDDGRAACGFLATKTTQANWQSLDYDGIWYLYMATSYDRGRTWSLVNVTPGDPVQGQGGICLSGQGCTSTPNNRNLLDFNEITLDDHGRVLYGYDDGCVGPCVRRPDVAHNDFTSSMRVARQVGGNPLIAGHDEPGTGTVPAASCLEGTAGGSGMQLSWRTPDDGGKAVSGYTVSRLKTGTGEVRKFPATGAFFLDPDNTTGAGYLYAVKATNANGTSAFSNVVGGSGTIPDVPDNTPPTASLSLATAGPLYTGAPVAFTATGNDADAGDTLAYDVDFGDGSAHGTSGGTVTHAFAAAGQYTVTLTVTDSHDASAQSQVSVTIQQQTIDSDPDPFTYVERDNVVTSAFITSEARAMSGFDGELAVGVSTNNNSQYSVNGGAWTSAAGVVRAGDSLAVRHLSASSASTRVDTTVTVGSYGTLFTSVTSAADRTPDAFTFGTKTGVTGGTVVESDPATLTGFNTAIALVAGPGLEYSVDNGPWTAASGSLNPGQVLKVRHTATTTSMGYTKTYLKAGGVTGYFTTRTK